MISINNALHTSWLPLQKGEMDERIRCHNWESTALGSREHWPAELKYQLKIMLRTTHPMLICWGEDLLQLYNDAFIPVLGTGKHPTALGLSARDTYAESWNIIEPIFRQVFRGETISHQNLKIPLIRNSQLQDCYFNFSYSPIVDDDDNVKGILVICIETTENVNAVQDLQCSNQQLGEIMETLEETNSALLESEENIRNLILQSPVAMALLKGPDMVVEIINDNFIQLWGKDESVRGKPIEQALPEMKGQPYVDILKQVYLTGTPYFGEEARVYLFRNGQLEPCYFNFINHPFRNGQGEITGIIVVAHEVTDSKHYKERLQHIIRELQDSESRFKNLVENAPVGIAIYHGRDLIIEMSNQTMLNMWGKDRSVIGKPLAEALPELVSEKQPFLRIVNRVFSSGEQYNGTEERVLLQHEDGLKEGFYNYIFQPLKDETGRPYAMMQVAIDATQQVASRMELQRAEEMLRFSVEAAKAALWSMDVETRDFTVSKEFSSIYGLEAGITPSYSNVMAQIPDDYANRLLLAVERAIRNGSGYNMEHPVKSPDGRQRWVKAFGNFNPATLFSPATFSGLTIDITEQKQDELRKNDFIGMVSHELKTPLTSLSAIVQVMKSKLSLQEDQFLNNAAFNAEKQVKRMTAMINGFLNISRLESGKIQLKKEHFDLEELLEEIVGEARLLNQGHLIHFEHCQTTPIHADRDKISSVISNLLSNAAKYSPKSSNIYLNCVSDNSAVQVSVRDEGMGIKPDDQKKLFERYYRVEDQATKHISGFGIGLYLSAEIVHLHGGTIRVSSESGSGATFTFTLPILS